jgi:hypothetical protein
MASTTRQVINQACAMCKIIDDGEEADGVDAQLSLRLLNQVLGSANSQQLFPHLQSVVDVVANKQDITIGTDITADVVARRPDIINRITYVQGGSPSELSRLDIPDLYARRLDGSMGTPSYFAYNAGYPMGTIVLDRIPSGGILRVIYMADVAVDSIDDDLSHIPPKYEDFLVTQLARRLAVHKNRPPEIVSNIDKLASYAMSAIKTSNSAAQIVTVEDFTSNRIRRSSFLGAY